MIMAKETLPKSDSPMIIFRVQKSRWFLIGPLAALLIAAILLITLLIAFNPAQGVNVWIQLGLFGVGVFGFIIAAIVVWLDWNNTYYILTTQTVERVTDFVTHNKTYMSLYDLAKIECRTGIMGGIFDFGTVVLESETSETPLYLTGVGSPTEIVNLIRQARAHVGEIRGPNSAP